MDRANTNQHRCLFRAGSIRLLALLCVLMLLTGCVRTGQTPLAAAPFPQRMAEALTARNGYHIKAAVLYDKTGAGHWETTLGYRRQPLLVGLEVGFIYAYKAGWAVSTAQIVQSAILAVALLFVGFFLYREPLHWNKIVGVVICLAGLFVINLK